MSLQLEPKYWTKLTFSAGTYGIWNYLTTKLIKTFLFYLFILFKKNNNIFLNSKMPVIY